MDTTPRIRNLKVIPAVWTERPEFRTWLRELHAEFKAHLTTKSGRSPVTRTAASEEKPPSSTNKSRTPEAPTHSIARRRLKANGARRREQQSS
jgi:hypothetical protein